MKLDYAVTDNYVVGIILLSTTTKVVLGTSHLHQESWIYWTQNLYFFDINNALDLALEAETCWVKQPGRS